MSGKNILEIIENFRQQRLSYSRMLDLANEQLAILEKSQGNVYAGEVDDLLQQRKEALEKIKEDDRQNKELQQEIIMELDIEGFVLGQLEDKLEPAHYMALSEQLNGLSILLEKISESDKRNHDLMQRAIDSKRQIKNPPLQNSQKASQAYRQSKLNRD